MMSCNRVISSNIGYTTRMRRFSVSLNHCVGVGLYHIMLRAACAVVVVPQCMSEATSVCHARSTNSYITTELHSYTEEPYSYYLYTTSSAFDL